MSDSIQSVYSIRLKLSSGIYFCNNSYINCFVEVLTCKEFETIREKPNIK